MANTIASTAAPGTPEPEHEATAFGIAAGGWVAIAMLVVFAIAIIAKVPAMIGRMLDGKIADIRQQLDTAKQLRAEAEALKAEYEAKARDADKEVEALRVSAAQQADEIVAKAKADATALIARHSAMAEEKIAAAERAVIAEIRATAADAATNAARALIAEKHNAGADKALVDKTIAALGRLN
ncbi:MAG: F0F1 ATP synthase subunit B [Sphingomonas sp.]|uniref:F0F1 ATP synthase subunit B family protein n=1 Tax=Sphingomonas sp. TaxID=28214 RepID=UPI001220650A|nr:F0F1 ATP synthase subunit B [Sphingomonas sp.]THD37356.1 MAG: F0F1 ATP synthase subunit B [Sphingomonas sp.]